MTSDILLLLGGVAVVVFTADRMVLASADLARRWNISPVIVGAVIIGFGSSLPEMMVSILSLDQPNGLDLAIGNVVGSNIANISLILAVAVIVFPFGGQSGVIKREGMLMLGASLLATYFLWDGSIDTYEGALLLLGLGLAGFAVISWSRGASRAGEVAEPPERATWVNLVIAVLALACLLAGPRHGHWSREHRPRDRSERGSRWPDGPRPRNQPPRAGDRHSIGTSRPEGVGAGQRARIHVFNALGVVGAVGVLGPGSLVTDFRPNLVVMIAVAVLAGVVALSGNRLRRIEGFLLLGAYPSAIALAL